MLNGAELAAIKKQINSDESDKEGELKKCIEQKISGAQDAAAEAKDDFIPLKTRSLRSVLRQRNNDYLSDSDSEPPEESERSGDHQLVRSADVAQEEASDASLDSSDEEAKWEQHLVNRGLSGPGRVRCAGAGHHPRCKKRTAVMRSGTGGAVRGGVVRARDAAAGDGAERAARGLRGGGRGARR